MITVYALKSRFQNLLRPICQWLADRGVTANQVTSLAMILSLLYGIALCFNLSVLWVCLPVFLFVRMGLNAIDGMLARDHDMKSKLGMALNELGDVVSDTALFIPFAIYAPESAFIIAAFIYCAVLTELCGVLAFMISGERRYDGPMGKSDRAAVTGTLGFIIGLGVSLQAYIGWVFLVLSILCVLTSLKRLKGAISHD